LTEIKGTLDGWKSEVAAKCAGNSRLLFSLGTAFASPLLPLAQIESGGFHLVGTTSIGKTTALNLAASVAGLKTIPSWRSTSNALETAIRIHLGTAQDAYLTKLVEARKVEGFVGEASSKKLKPQLAQGIG
jgi:uncharacterized protein (DUF927 family)